MGRVEIGGRPHDLVTYVASDGRQSTLAFDAYSSLPRLYEYLYTRSATGDASFAAEFRDWESVGATRVPTRRVTYDAGFLSSDARFVEVDLEDPFAGLALGIPPGFVELETVEPEPAVVELAEGVHLLRNLPGGFNALFVAFEDHALVVEAPESDVPSGIAARVIETVRETLPDRPIRYVVLTHHHADHASGARTFLAEGAAVVTTPGNAAFVERLAAAPFTLAPDALARRRSPVRIEIVEDGRRVFEDPSRRVEVYDLGPIPHAEEMLVVHLPAERILYQSDLFNPVTPEGPEPIAYHDAWHGVDPEDTRHLLAYIREEGLDVERIVGSHGRVATLAELERGAESAPAE
jgi:glyoxylase-like metal-dependent hydrolase (beta-lactamase superfamily II)